MPHDFDAAADEAFLAVMRDVREEERRQTTWLVPSRTNEGSMYRVLVDWRGDARCECKGFRFKGACFHSTHYQEQGTMVHEFDEANDFLAEGGVPSAKFDTVGKWVSGTIVAAEKRQQTKVGSGELLFWDDGRPRNQLVVTIQTDETSDDIEGDDGQRRIYARGIMLNELRKAIRPHGGKIEPGGKLAVRYTGDGEKKPGMNPPKLYQVKYEPPTKSAQVDDADLDDSPF